MMERQQLLELLIRLAYEKRKVVLSSGRESDFYIDTKQASLSAEGIVAVHDATRWPEKPPQQPLLTFRADKTWVRGSLAFSPDGQGLVVPGDENTVTI